MHSPLRDAQIISSCLLAILIFQRLIVPFLKTSAFPRLLLEAHDVLLIIVFLLIMMIRAVLSEHQSIHSDHSHIIQELQGVQPNIKDVSATEILCRDRLPELQKLNAISCDGKMVLFNVLPDLFSIEHFRHILRHAHSNEQMQELELILDERYRAIWRDSIKPYLPYTHKIMTHFHPLRYEGCRVVFEAIHIDSPRGLSPEMHFSILDYPFFKKISVGTNIVRSLEMMKIEYGTRIFADLMLLYEGYRQDGRYRR